jgi:DNA-binding beta-propeller fold protein YncE
VRGFAEGAAGGAEFNTPLGVATDSAGNIYVADAGNDRIRMIAADSHTVSTLAGSGRRGLVDGPGASAEFGYQSTAAPAGRLRCFHPEGAGDARNQPKGPASAKDLLPLVEDFELVELDRVGVAVVASAAADTFTPIPSRPFIPALACPGKVQRNS